MLRSLSIYPLPPVRTVVAPIEFEPGGNKERMNWRDTDRHSRTEQWRGSCSRRVREQRTLPAHALSPEERAQVLHAANEPRFADMPPARNVPMLAEEGVYIASESTFARALREQGQLARRGRAKAPSGTPTEHAHRDGTSPGVVLGHDVPAGGGDRTMVPPLPGSGLIQLKDRGLGGA